jgi:phosphopentomutase
MAMRAAGKDSISGHWELMGVTLERDFPLFPQGFPADALAALRRATGRELIGNRAASGTAIIEELGEEHLRTGALILYTSADSVCQLAAHENVVSPAALLEAGRRAREVMTGPWGVARVIIRPFTGTPGTFRRLDSARRDFSLPPPAPTLLDRMVASGYQVAGVGKVEDLFAGRGFTRGLPARDNSHAAALTAETLSSTWTGLLLVNFNDTDTVYGHRNDVDGYARALERADALLAAVGAALRENELMLIVSDHGNDPTTPGTDHSREYTPLLAWRPGLAAAIDLGTRATLADAGQTAAANFGLDLLPTGTSFLNAITR